MKFKKVKNHPTQFITHQSLMFFVVAVDILIGSFADIFVGVYVGISVESFSGKIYNLQFAKYKN